MLITNILLRRSGIWNLAFKHHWKFLKLTEKFENSLKNLKTHEAQVFLNVCLVRILICEVEESALSNVLEREGRSLWLRPVLISDWLTVIASISADGGHGRRRLGIWKEEKTCAICFSGCTHKCGTRRKLGVWLSGTLVTEVGIGCWSFWGIFDKLFTLWVSISFHLDF